MKTIYLSVAAMAVALSFAAASPADARVRTGHGVFSNGHRTVTADTRVERRRGFRERDATFTGQNGRQRTVHDERTWNRADGTYSRERDVTGPGGRTRSVDVDAQRTAPGIYAVDRTVTGRNGETRTQSGSFEVHRGE